MSSPVLRARAASRAAVAVVLLSALAGCGSDAKPPAPPPPAVTAVRVASAPLPSRIDLPGRVQAVRTAEVRARVDGIVERRNYVEGTDVKAGAVLFEIDPRPLRAAVSAASAALERARAERVNAEGDVARFKPLVERNAVSRQEFDAAIARAAQAAADVGSASAQLESARLNLAYASVTAPISGRAGRAQVTEGALVSGAQGTLLTTIEQLDPIYVNFSQSSNVLLQIRRRIASGKLQVRGIGKTPVQLRFEDGTPYERDGLLNFLDQSVDPATGTVSIRAEFPNPTRLLLPGEFVRATIDVGVQPSAIVVPQRAVQLADQGASVMLVAANGTATPRKVEVGELVAGDWEIRSGLADGDLVITDGLQKVRPGAPVQATIVAANARAAPASR